MIRSPLLRVRLRCFLVPEKKAAKILSPHNPLRSTSGSTSCVANVDEYG
jgi:hypothetical protein